MNEEHFYGVGDRVVDTLLLYALSDLVKAADPRSTFSWNPGGEIIFSLYSHKPEIKDEMLNVLKENARSISIANRLDFKLNVGKEWKVNQLACLYCRGNKKGGLTKEEEEAGERVKLACKIGKCGKVVIPAYAVFFQNLVKLKSIDWSNAYCISKERIEDYETLYLGLSPFWSKGIRQWNAQWEGQSSYVPSAIQVLLLYALGKYAIIIPPGKSGMLIELIFSPLLGYHEYKEASRMMSLVRRLVMRFNRDVRNIRMGELPINIVPLVMLSRMDLPSITEISRGKLELLLIAYDMDRGHPKNPRGYEEQSLFHIANFYSRLGSSFWNFKCMIEDLCIIRGPLWNEFKNRILDILIDFFYAISGRNLWRLNDAVFKAEKLAEELLKRGHRVYLPSRDSILDAYRAIESVRSVS